MKKENRAVLLASAAYSILFYDQNAGLNFLLFSLLIVGLFALGDKSLIKNRSWQPIAGLTILSGIFILLYGSWLAILGNCVCLLLLASYSLRARSGIVVNLFTGMVSVGGSMVIMINNVTKSLTGKTGIATPLGRILVYAIPLLIALVFFFIYKTANPLFEKYTKVINLDFISWEWVLFTAGGIVVVYGLFRQERITALDKWEEDRTETILNKDLEERPYEKRSALVLFVLLNLMLVFINVLDINYLYLGAGMPQGITHKQFVHHGVGMLILSIVMGIVVVLYYFRGSLNFSEGSKTLKLMVYIWLAQNILMVISTALRNKMYIDDALLTYKRIGVYYWLFLAALGLMTTIIKVRNAKTKWYLLKYNSSMAFVILILSGGLDWDKFITDHNISHSNNMASLDKRYMISLSETNLAQLYAIKDHKEFNTDSAFHYGYYNKGPMTNESMLDVKIYIFLNDIQNEDWRSFSFRKKRVKEEITRADMADKVTRLDLSGRYVDNLNALTVFNNLAELKLTYCDHKIYNDLSQFKKLEKLTVSEVNEMDIIRLSRIKSLRSITVRNTSGEMIKKMEFSMPGKKIEEA